MNAAPGDTLDTVGEFGLIRQLRRQWPASSPLVRHGIGDDAAVLTPPPGHQLLVSADAFIEGVHFDRAYETLRDVGFRAGAANVSDIAAMGGRPLCLLVSMAVPARVPARQIRELYRGIRDACGADAVDLVGGDTSSSPGRIFLALTILGAIPANRALTRSGAKAGDRLYVTGTLGDARAGRHILRARARRRHPSGLSAGETFLTRRHLRPTPRLGIGQALAARGVAHAAIDLSDGLSGDAGHLCDSSQVGIEIRGNALPLSPHLRAFARRRRLDPVEFALTGGDDYELLFTAAAAHHDTVLTLARRAGVPVAWIGDVTPKRAGRRLLLPQGRAGALVPNGYRHFAARRTARR